MLQLKKKNMEFISAGRRMTARPFGERVIDYLGAGVLALAIVSIGITSIRYEYSAARDTRIEKKLLAGIDEAQTGEKKEQMGLLEGELQEWKLYDAGMKELLSRTEGYRRIDRTMINEVLRLGEGRVLLNRISFEDGDLKISAEVTACEEASAYIKRLESSGMFTKIDYRGFENQFDMTNQPGPPYTFEASAKLKGGEGS